jgi:hypothetical protein
MRRRPAAQVARVAEWSLGDQVETPRSVDEVVLDNEVMGSGRRDDQHP